MSLTFDDQSALDKYNRLRRQAQILEGEVSDEDFTRFTDYAWHLRDWIRNDPIAPAFARDEVKSWNGMPPCRPLAICQDIINSDKHLKLNYPPSIERQESESGYGLGRYGKGGYGIGEREITLTMKDGTVLDALEVVRSAVRFWEEFFSRHYPGLPPYRTLSGS